MKTRVRAVLPALLVSALAVLGVGTAVPAVAAQTSSSSQQSPAEGQDVYRGWYLSKESCRDAGDAGITRGHWDNYSCAPGKGGLLHHLWSNR
ncbi:hypothetical protein [Streptomyces sp. CRN 30]|uniref:hypothetical protein n=1 Tax=Streptomyces sp. CRN 30 TaxID=3075613 RepID=UPI002A8095C9|nr:hypothetical protein [Streptomyces sp. CRN 30]